MKFKDFLQLHEDLQYQLIWDQGQHIETTVHENRTCQLYAINAFYVELRYNVETNKVADAIPFTGGKMLEKYLRVIPVEI